MIKTVSTDFSKLTYQDIKSLVLNRLRKGYSEPDLSDTQVSWAYNEAMRIVMQRNICHDQKKLRIWMYHLTFVFCKKMLGSLSPEMNDWLTKADFKKEVAPQELKHITISRPYFNYMSTYED